MSEKSSESEMIFVEGICKFYGPFAAVKDVSFSVPKRQVCAFLGPNGAGKSTTMKMLTGFLAPTRGSIRIAGHDIQDARIAASEHIGYLPENGPVVRRDDSQECTALSWEGSWVEKRSYEREIELRC